MASIYDLKPKFQQLLQPPTRALYHAGVTANQVTVAAAAASLACGAWLAWLIDRRNSAGTPVGMGWLTGIIALCCALLLLTIWKRARNALAQSTMEAGAR